MWMDVYFAASMLLSISAAYDPTPSFITPLKAIAPGDAIPFEAAQQEAVSKTQRRSGGRRKRINFRFAPVGRTYKLNEQEINEQDLYSNIKMRRRRPLGFLGTGYGPRCTLLNSMGKRCSQVTRAGFSTCDYHTGMQEVPRLKASASANIEGGPQELAPMMETKKKVTKKMRFIKELYANTVPVSFS